MNPFITHGVAMTLLFAGMMPAIALPATPAKPDKTIHVVFRYDDFSAKSPTQTELKIIQAFQKHKARLTFGVIPFVCAGDQHNPSPQDTLALTPEKTRILKKTVQQGIVDVALHGFSHQTHQAGFLSEFAGADYSSQLNKLKQAKTYLEQITRNPINTFVPPWNRYDRNTLQALEKLNFKTLSASENEPSAENSQLNFLPFSVGLPHLRDAVQAARNSSDTRPLLIVLFHGYDFQSSQDSRAHITFKEFSSMLSWLSSQEDVEILSIKQASEMLGEVDAKRYIANKKHNLLSSLLPLPLRAEPSKTSYREKQVLETTQWKVAGFYLAILLFGGMLALLSGRWILPRSAHVRKTARFSGLALALGVSLLVFHDLETSMKGLMVASLVVGAFIGTLFPSFVPKYRPG